MAKQMYKEKKFICLYQKMPIELFMGVVILRIGDGLSVLKDILEVNHTNDDLVILLTLGDSKV